jgi:hypothetical protein
MRHRPRQTDWGKVGRSIRDDIDDLYRCLIATPREPSPRRSGIATRAADLRLRGRTKHPIAIA